MLDTNDYKIVRQLMNQARTTWAELGSLLGLTAPAAAERVRKLEEKGVIRGYCAVVDPESIDCAMTAFIAVVMEHPRNRRMFLETIQSMPEIQECHHMAGEDDYLLKVRCKNTRQLEYLISERLKVVPGVQKTKTTVILSTLKETPILPVQEVL